MKKTIYIMSGTFLLLLLILILGKERASSFTPDAQIYKELFQDMDSTGIDQIVMQPGDKPRLELKKQGENWGVSTLYNYPADKSKMADLLSNLKTLRVIDVRTQNPALYGHFDLTANQALHVILFMKNRPVVDFYLGKSSETGNYVRVKGNEAVFETSPDLAPAIGVSAAVKTPQANFFLDNVVLKFKKEEVVEIHLQREEAITKLRRSLSERSKPAEKNTPETTGPDKEKAPDIEVKWIVFEPESFEVRAGVGDKIVSDLTEVICETVAPDKDDEKYGFQSPSGIATVRLKGDVSLTLTFGKKEQDLYYVKSSYRKGVFRIKDYLFAGILKPLNELKPERPEIETREPEAIEASHILIAFKGAKEAVVERTRPQARELAEKILLAARQKGANFKELAKKGSDCPSKSRGGYLGRFGKGAMLPAFEDIAFKLKVGEVSDIVETSYGFHIILRHSDKKEAEQGDKKPEIEILPKGDEEL